MGEERELEPIERLTDRQRQALRLYAAKLKLKEIGIRMSISEHTASTYLSEAGRLLGAGRRAAATQLMGYEETHPEARGRFSVGDPDQPIMVVTVPAPEQPRPAERRWTRLLPLRIGKGAPHDLSPLLRLVWIVVLAAILAIVLEVAFSQLVVFASFLNSGLPRVARPR